MYGDHNSDNRITDNIKDCYDKYCNDTTITMIVCYNLCLLCFMKRDMYDVISLKGPVFNY